MDYGRTIDDWFARRREELVEVLSALIACRSENPPGDEAAAAEVVTDYFDACGIPYERHDAAPRRANVIGRVGAGPTTLFAAGHLDVVPAGEGWTRDPFRPVVEGGRLTGRGAGDNKGPTAGLLLTARCLKECFALKGTLLAGAVADEEHGSVLGLNWLLQKKKLRADLAVIPDIGGNMADIDVAEKGLIQVEIVAHGRQAHAARPEAGVNAIWHLIAALNKLKARGLPQVEHPLHTPATHNLGIIRGGSAVNVVPARATAAVDFRFLPGQSADELLDLVRGVLREVEAENDGARLEVAETIRLNPSEVARDHRLVRVIQDEARAAAGIDPQPIAIGGVTVAKQLNEAGIAAVGWGPGDNDLFHMADESVDLDELLAYGRIMARIAVRLLGAEGVEAAP
jgi:acetylornithine deacetylase/succinyl-diaminopimelate desuccinylase family protein